MSMPFALTVGKPPLLLFVPGRSVGAVVVPGAGSQVADREHQAASQPARYDVSPPEQAGRDVNPPKGPRPACSTHPRWGRSDAGPGSSRGGGAPREPRDHVGPGGRRATGTDGDADEAPSARRSLG